jgi:hypothetical protein
MRKSLLLRTLRAKHGGFAGQARRLLITAERKAGRKGRAAITAAAL